MVCPVEEKPKEEVQCLTVSEGTSMNVRLNANEAQPFFDLSFLTSQLVPCPSMRFLWVKAALPLLTLIWMKSVIRFQTTC